METINTLNSPEADPLIGREWVMTKIGKTVDIRLQCPSVTVILGGTGSGKTVLLRRVHRSSRFKDNIIAIYECTDDCDVHHFIAFVEKQIKDKLIYKSLSVSASYNNDDDTFTKDDVFRNCILFPLLESELTKCETQRYIMIIDSIDLNHDICELISNHIHLLPKWLHIIVSARPKRMKGFTKMFSGSRKIVIDDMRKVNVINDMKCYIMQRIKKLNCGPMGHSGKKALNQIGIKSNGCFLYVKIILDCFERGLLGIEHIDDIGATLNGLYIALCTKLYDANHEYEYDYKIIISIILASFDAKIEKQSLERCFHCDNYFDARIDELCLYSMLKMDDTGTVQLNHTSIIEWITDIKHCTKRFLCERSFGHTLIALSQSICSINELHYHISNTNIDNFNIEHYALWLILSSNAEGINELFESVDEYPIIDYIQKCKKSLWENSVKCKRNVHSNSFVTAKSSHLRKSYMCHDIEELSDESSQNQSDDTDLQNQFYRCIFKNEVSVIRDILTNHTDFLNQCNCHEQMTPLFWAIKNVNIEIVELLLEFDADVNAVCDNENGLTPLMVAVAMNCEDICELLLEADSDVDACDSSGRSAIVHAIINHASPKTIELLLFWGSHTDYIDSMGRSLLCIAANESQCPVETARLLLAVGCDELHKDNNGRNALHLAAVHGNTEVIDALLDIGGDPLLNAKDNEGKIALHDSASGGHLESCKLLISPDTINALSHDGKSALRAAALNGHYDVIIMLIENGADINYIDADGRSTFYCVASGCRDDITTVRTLEHLARYGADLEIRDFEGRTALHVASWQGLNMIVAVLIELGANVNAIDSEGRTPLHMCAWNGHSEIVNVLIEAGSDVNRVSTTQGATPLLIAAQQGHIDACLMLLNAGSNADHIDFYGRNAKDVASNCGHRDISILLESRLTDQGDQCPTLSSHASTAETAAIGEIEALFDHCQKSHSNHKKENSHESSRKHRKIMSLSKLTKLLH